MDGDLAAGAGTTLAVVPIVVNAGGALLPALEAALGTPLSGRRSRSC